MKIACDFDGVIQDWEKWIRAYGDLYNMDTLKNNNFRNKDVFDMFVGLGWKTKEVLDFSYKYFPDACLKAPVLPLAAEMIKRIKNDGHKFYILSARNGFKQMIEAANQVLKENNIEVDGWLDGECKFNGISWSMDKVRSCEKHNVDLMIEDNPEHAEKIAALGIPVIFMRDKTTRKVEHENVFDVDNWVEIYKVIKSLESKSSKI